MNAKDIIGIKIINNEAKEIAKIADIDFDIKSYKITKAYGSFGGPMSKKFYEVEPDSIITLGDFLLINTPQKDLEKNILEKIPEKEGNILKVNDIIGKTVIDCEGNIAGKITNINVDFIKFEIENLTIEKSTSFGMNKDTHTISKEDIINIGDYVMVNKIFKSTQETKEKKDDKKDDTKKVKVDIE